MGFLLLPGHIDKENDGLFCEVTKAEISAGIKPKDPTIQYQNGWGNKGHKPYYSIPSPFATAFFFKSAIKTVKDDTTEMTKEVIELILCFLYDVFKGKISVNFIKKPKPNDSFNHFWKMAPDFVKYPFGVEENKEGLVVFEKDNKIIGGLSEESLVWLAPRYLPEKTILFNDLEYEGNRVSKISPNDREKFKSFLRFIIKKDENSFRALNGLLLFSEFVNGNSIPEESRFEYIGKFDDADYCKWLYKWKEDINGKVIDIKYFGDYDKNENFSILDKEENHKLCYPFDVKLLSKNRIKDLDVKSTNSNYTIKYEAYGSPETKSINKTDIITDERCLAIYPPFASDTCEVYIIEMVENEIESYNELVFYDENGEKIKVGETYHWDEKGEDDKKIHYRLYRLEKKKFPHFIEFSKDDAKGILKVKPRDKKDFTSEEAIVGFDFGTIHTIILYAIGNEEPKKFTFKNSRPLIISDKMKAPIFLKYFVPDGLSEEIPKSNKELYDLSLKGSTWQPFKTSFLQNDRSSKDFLKSGAILFGLLVSKIDNIKDNLKWDLKNTVELEAYLIYLLTLIKVEMEALGVKKDNIEVGWAYPEAFHEKNLEIFNKCWTNVIDEEKLFKTFESIAVKRYFQKNNKLTAGKDSFVLTIDIGGGTSDFSFFDNKNRVEILDSIKFAGNDISETVLKFIESYREKKGEIFIDLSIKKYEDLVRTWPFVHPTWGKTSGVTDFHLMKSNDEEWNLFIKRLALFYGSLFWWCGLHLKKYNEKNKKEITVDKVALAGNGSSFMRFISAGENPDTSKEEDIINFKKLLHKLLTDAQIVETSRNLKLNFSKNPKEEVARGLIYYKKSNSMEDSVKELTNKSQKMFGIKIGNCEILNYDEEISKFNGQKIGENIDDISEIEKFIGSLNEGLIDFFEFEEEEMIELSNNDFISNLKNEFENIGGNHLETPPFFTAIKLIIENIEDYSTEEDDIDYVPDIDEEELEEAQKSFE